jgi:hypothetical protein
VAPCLDTNVIYWVPYQDEQHFADRPAINPRASVTMHLRSQTDGEIVPKPQRSPCAVHSPFRWDGDQEAVGRTSRRRVTASKRSDVLVTCDRYRGGSQEGIPCQLRTSHGSEEREGGGSVGGAEKAGSRQMKSFIYPRPRWDVPQLPPGIICDGRAPRLPDGSRIAQSNSEI